LFLSFTLGYHHSNNAIWYFYEYGVEATKNALTSFGGIIISTFLIMILIYVLRNIDIVSSKTWSLIKDAFTRSD